MFRRALLASALIVAFSAGPVRAEHPVQERGFRADGVYQLTGLDTVNLFNGNLLISIPLGQAYPVSSTLSYQVVLRYAGNVWKFSERCDVNPMNGDDGCRTLAFAIADNAGLGWEVSFGSLSAPGTTTTERTTTGWRYTSPDRSEHYFYKTLHDGDAEDAGDTDGTQVTYTRDGSYLRMKTVSAGVRVIEFPDGQKQRFATDASGKWQLTDIYNAHSTLDAYGVPQSNYVRFAWQVNALTGLPDLYIRDSAGREQIIRYKPKVTGVTNEPRIDTIDLVGVGGARAVHTFEYMNSGGSEEITLWKPYRARESGTGGVDYQKSSFLTRLWLPNNEYYQFGYFIPAAAHDQSGTLQEMILPTLGKIEWDYSNMNFGAETPYEQSVGISARRLYDWSQALGQHKLQQYTKYEGGGAGTNTVSTMVGWTDDLGTNARVDYKTVNYFVSVEPPDTWPSNLGLPYLSTARTGTVPNPDASGRYLSIETFDCNVSTGACTAERATYVKYERDDLDTCSVYGDPCSSDQNRRVVSESTVYVTDANRYAAMDYSNFDGLGHYRTTSTSGNFGRGDVRTTTIDFNLNTRLYNPATWSGYSVGTYSVDVNGQRNGTFQMLAASDAWVLSTYTGSRVTENGVTAYSQSCFDPQKNFLVRKRTMKGATPGINDLLSVYTAGTNGRVDREESFGGDHQTISTAALCTMALPAHSQYSFRVDHLYAPNGVLRQSQYKDTAGGTSGGLDFFVVDNDVDNSTGLVTASRDAAGISTAYEYDVMGRLSWVKPQSGHGAWTHYDHRLAAHTAMGRAQMAIYQHPNGNTGVILARNSVEYDGLGRVYRENQLLSDGGWNTKDTRYDHSGRVGKVSSVETFPGNFVDPANWMTSTYDPYGRPLTIAGPDGKTSTYSYVGVSYATRTNTVGATVSGNSVSEVSVNTGENYDRQGRLWKLSEAANSTSLATTEYTYDGGGRLTTVCSSPSAGVCTQTRVLTYDNRGLLYSEKHPEKNNADIRSTFDARGHVVTRTEGASTANFSLTYVYDRAERLTSVLETNRSSRAVKQFTFGTANSLNPDATWNYKKGKLETATRYNYDRPGVTGEVAVADTFTYSGIGGRTSRRVTDVRNGATTLASFHASFTWNELGAPVAVVYPDCAAPASCGNSDLSYGRTVTNGYSYGSLISVGPYATSITYHPNGMLNTVVHGNNTRTIHGRDSWQLARPLNITVQDGVSGVNLWQSDNYAYDGAGNITRIGANYYAYDRLGRLTEGSAEYASTASNKYQRYAYDKFGNMTSATTYLNGVASLTRTIGITTATNRLCGACTGSNIGTTAYDDSGNLTTYGSQSYAYDSQNMMAAFSGMSSAFSHYYTADDERIWSHNTLTNTSRWTVRGLDQKVLREYTTSGSALAQTWSFAKDHVYRGGSQLASITPSATSYLHLDHLGSTRVVTDASRTVTGRFNYYPFGEEATSIVAASAERLKFTGHERDYNGGTASDNKDYLDYMHARYNNPMIGRFLSPDRVLGSVAAPQSWNRYAYARNNPINNYDPDGNVVIGATQYRKEIARAYANSPTFRQVYDAVNKNPNIVVRIMPPAQMNGNFRAKTEPVTSGNAMSVMRDANGGLVKDGNGTVVTTSKAFQTTLPPGATMAVLGHELTHSGEGAKYGYVNKNGALVPQAPTTYLNTTAGVKNAYETRTANNAEAAIKQELAAKSNNKLTPEQAKEVFGPSEEFDKMDKAQQLQCSIDPTCYGSSGQGIARK